jgi:hypothetical protein
MNSQYLTLNARDNQAIYSYRRCRRIHSEMGKEKVRMSFQELTTDDYGRTPFNDSLNATWNRFPHFYILLQVRKFKNQGQQKSRSKSNGTYTDQMYITANMHDNRINQLEQNLRNRRGKPDVIDVMVVLKNQYGCMFINLCSFVESMLGINPWIPHPESGIPAFFPIPGLYCPNPRNLGLGKLLLLLLLLFVYSTKYRQNQWEQSGTHRQ